MGKKPWAFKNSYLLFFFLVLCFTEKIVNAFGKGLI